MELRQLTCEERVEALDPDASTTAPWPEGRENQPCIHRCEEEFEAEDISDDLADHDIDCTCIFCIPGA